MKTKEQRKEYDKIYYEKNKLKRRKQNEIWRNDHKKHRSEMARIRHNERRKIDVVFKLKHNLRVRLTNVFKFKLKTGSAVRDLGCTGEYLKQYLESKFQPGMHWNNWGNKADQWSIDHILPLSSFNLENREEFLKACHYTNLQPMWHIDNLKKSDKIKKESE